MKLVIYWSGTGNTEIMAQEIHKTLEDSKLLYVSEVDLEDVRQADGLALGCPAMGAEVLEEGEMEPFMEEIEGLIKDKKIVLFGSYDWGDGQWMREWEDRIKEAGANLLQEGLIVQNTPTEDDLDLCRSLGKNLANVPL